MACFCQFILLAAIVTDPVKTLAFCFSLCVAVRATIENTIQAVGPERLFDHDLIALLPLDGRILTGPSVIAGGVCDGMLLTDKEMCFIEFKTNVTSSNYQTITQRANDAIDQLWHTFDGIIKPKCATQSIAGQPIDVEHKLFVDFHVVFDKDLEVTEASSELMDLQLQFLTDKSHPLYFDDGKVFQ